MKKANKVVKATKVAKTNKGGSTMKKHTLGFYFKQWNRKAGFNDKFEVYNGKKKLTDAEIRTCLDIEVQEISIENGDKLNYICWINTKGSNTMKKMYLVTDKDGNKLVYSSKKVKGGKIVKEGEDFRFTDKGWAKLFKGEGTFKAHYGFDDEGALLYITVEDRKGVCADLIEGMNIENNSIIDLDNVVLYDFVNSDEYREAYKNK